MITRQLPRCIWSICSGCKNSLPLALNAYRPVSKPAITHATIFLVFDISVVAASIFFKNQILRCNVIWKNIYIMFRIVN